MFDITNQKSFDNIEMWLQDLKESADDDIVLMLLGNKADLVIKRPELRKVTSEEAQEFAGQHGLLFKEVTAYSNVEIQDTFEKLIDEIYERKNAINTLRGKSSLMNYDEIDDLMQLTSARLKQNNNSNNSNNDNMHNKNSADQHSIKTEQQ